MIDGVFSSVIYAGVVKKLVYRFKYPPYLTSLRPLLIDIFYEGLIQKEVFTSILQTTTVFVPIPLHASRLKKRGYNQSQLLAESLAKRFGLVSLACLERVKKTQPQFGLSKEDREINIKGAFALKKQRTHSLSGMHVFLVDDVATSGATLREAAKVLKRAGVGKVWGITLAHGE
jgi:competence protein ComFC